jgi:hypothetical protein
MLDGKIVYSIKNWIHLTWIVDYLKVDEPFDFINFIKSRCSISYSRRTMLRAVFYMYTVQHTLPRLYYFLLPRWKRTLLVILNGTHSAVTFTIQTGNDKIICLYILIANIYISLYVYTHMPFLKNPAIHTYNCYINHIFTCVIVNKSRLKEIRKCSNKIIQSWRTFVSLHKFSVLL